MNLDILENFAITGSYESCAELRRGHINDTYVSSWRENGTQRRYVHQRVNRHVFTDVPSLMNNIGLITEHLRRALPNRSRASDDTLELIFCRDGASFFKDAEGNYWRTYVYIEDTITYNKCPSAEVAFEAGGACGRFLSSLRDLPPSALTDTIPFFLHAPSRIDQLRHAVRQDEHGRLRAVREEVDFALARAATASQLALGLEQGTLPWRVTHNDTKLNNVLFDRASGHAFCVVDLDTCMGGSVLYDFGDLVRCTTVLAEEDEPNLSHIEVEAEYFRALSEGFLEPLREEMTGAEKALLVIAPQVLALMLGTRFLCDYLQGDHYFKVSHSEHNLVRARAQFQIVRNMEKRYKELEKILKGVVP